MTLLIVILLKKPIGLLEKSYSDSSTHFSSVPMHLVTLPVPSTMSNFTTSHAAPNHDLQKMLHCKIQALWLEFFSRTSRPPSRRISRRPGKKCGLASGKIAARRQQDRKKCRKNVRLKVTLPRDVRKNLAITVQSSYNNAVKLQCCIKIGKSEKIILFRTLWAIDFYVELYVAYTKKWRIYGFAELITSNNKMWRITRNSN